MSDYLEQQEIKLFCMGLDIDTGDLQDSFTNSGFPFGA